MAVQGESTPSIRAWAWHVLEAEAADRLGPTAWAEIVAAAAAPIPADIDATLPLDTMERAIHECAARLGEDPKRFEADFGRRLAARWGKHFALLVETHQGRPRRLLELFAQELHPWLFADPGSATLSRGADDEAFVRLSDRRLGHVRRGLLEGFVLLAGARPTVRSKDGAFHVQWRQGGEERFGPEWRAVIGTVRLPFLAATTVPVLLALALAARAGPIDLVSAALTLVGVHLFQLGANAVNDLYDGRNGEAPLPTRALHPLRLAAYGFYGAGSAIGLYLAAHHGAEVLWLGLAGFLLGFLYTAPPVRLAHRGLGELAVAVGFGPLIVAGTYFVQTHTWSPQAFLASIPLSFLIAGVLYVNELPDRAGDARVGKRTLIVRLPERPAVVVYVLLQALTYLLILGGVALQGVPSLAAYAFPTWSLLGLVTLPLMVRASILLARNYRYPYRLVPTNAGAVRLHLATAALFAAGYLLALLP